MQIDTSTARSPNPYQSPSDLPVAAQPNPLDDVLRSIGRLDFETTIESTDLIDAVAGARYRPEVRSIGQVVRIMALPGVLVAAVVIASDRPSITIGLLLLGIVLITFLLIARRRLIFAFANLNVDLVGPAKGYMDDKNFVIDQPNQTRVFSMDQLVSVGKNSRRVVLCFDATLNRFETLPFEAFKQINSAKMIVDQLARVRPVVKAQPIDRRREQLPTSDPIFEPSPLAIHYSGPVTVSALDSTELSRHWRRAINRAAFKVGGFSVVLVTTVLVVLGTSTAALIGCCAGLAALIPVWIRIFKIDREMHRDDKPLWQAKGWVESEGIVSMTTTGQSKTAWPVFGERSISENHIVMRYARAPLWYVLCRDQFQNDSDWNAVCQLAQDNIQTN